jgi:hypothetical protein
MGDWRDGSLRRLSEVFEYEWLRLTVRGFHFALERENGLEEMQAVAWDTVAVEKRISPLRGSR